MPISASLPDLVNHRGVRHVVEAIISSHKPLIGFQVMGDLVYMLGGIYEELPPRLTDFLQRMEELDVVVDLKAITGIPSLEEEGLVNSSLSKVYEKVCIQYTTQL